MITKMLARTGHWPGYQHRPRSSADPIRLRPLNGWTGHTILVMTFMDILQEARRRVPVVSVEPLPWPGEPEPTPEGTMCSCGHPYEKHDSGGRCQVPTGERAFGPAALCQCEGFALGACA
jgi:hypothetical protein